VYKANTWILLCLIPGMRMRLPESLLAGLMWFDPRRPDALANLRHEAQERDGKPKPVLPWKHGNMEAQPLRRRA
jgi:Glycosyl hydrolase family 63 N-terminal domain